MIPDLIGFLAHGSFPLPLADLITIIVAMKAVRMMLSVAHWTGAMMKIASS